MRTSMRALVVLAAGVSVLVARDVGASAPVDQYDAFLPSTRWIQDSKTQLRWQRQIDASQELTQAEAVTWCTSLDAGFKTRLPTYKELMTLVDDEPHDEYEGGTLVQKAIDREAFPGTPGKKFWTSTQSTDSPNTTFFTVDFGYGMGFKDNPDDKRLVRCVADP